MNIEIKNCNNIDYGNINIEEGTLNLKYALNGTGKSTIAKAISFANNETQLQRLLPFKYREKNDMKSEIQGIPNGYSCYIFNEDYVNQYEFQKTELIQNTFEVFIKTPEYVVLQEKIEELLKDTKDLFIDNNVLNEVYHQLDGTDIVYGNTEYTTGENRESKNEPPNFRFLYVSSFSHQSTFIRTKLLKLTPYDESLKIVADWKFFLQSLIMENRTFKSIDVKISLYDVTGISSTNKSLYEIERDQVLLSLIPRWMLEDYHKLIYGESWEERLFIEIRNSRYVSFFYSVNVCLIRMLAIFKKGSNWIKKYPIKLNKKKR